MIKFKKHNRYWTYDINLSAVLIYFGVHLEKMDKSNSKKIQFIFYKNKSVDSIIEQYWSDKLEVNPRTLFDNLKMIKNRIYSE